MPFSPRSVCCGNVPCTFECVVSADDDLWNLTTSYLRASKWNQAMAVQRLEETLKWRRDFGLYDKLTAGHVEPEVRRFNHASGRPLLTARIGSDR